MPDHWGKKPEPKKAPAALDDYVFKNKLKRINLNVPAAFHAKIKSQCALEGRDMTEVIIELLEHRFNTQVSK
jgi:hypothetical protein